MPVADQAFSWQEAIAAFAIISVAAFLVTWVITDLLRIPRSPYIPILLVVALGLGAAYLAWSGTSGSELISSNVGWGLVAGLIAAAIAIPLVRKLPEHPHATGARLVGLILWEGVVYGIAEAVLLATLPVLAVWQACADLGWTDGGLAKIGSGALATFGALFVILVHHLGYAEFRTQAGRRGLFGALVVCGLQAIAFLVTGNVLAPVLAHVVLHGQLLLRGAGLPPAVRNQPRLSSTPVGTPTGTMSTTR
ncbi:MAG TPA: hypothetical protein VFT27_13125 [Actinomycetota bacterium]|nr:hypothetical protein [Actinomycetota bacterium]